MSASAAAPVTFPAPFIPLFVPKRYKVFWGGRGGAKSWDIARALLILGMSPGILFPGKTKLTILCVRELQKSIDDSVHKLLREQILALGLSAFYTIEKEKIYGANGTTFSFEGIRNNVSSIRSYEGVDICWPEEANNISSHSWGVLIPTIRADNSEIWISFNPELETDYTYKHFVRDSRLVKVEDPAKRFAGEASLRKLFGPAFTLDPITCPVMESTDILSVKVSWRDNPWFPKVLRREMEKLKEENYDKYLHVWEGATVQNLEGAVYAKELREAQLEGRICTVPYASDVPVDVFWDLGKTNNTSLWFVQRVAMQWRVLRYYEASREELSHYLKVCQATGYFFGTMFLPHDARHKRMGYLNSVEEQVRNSGYNVAIVPATSDNDGINAARVVFPQCYFDEVGCEEGLNVLRRYCYKVDVRGQLTKLVNSDGADAFKYFAVSTKVRRVGNGVRVPAEGGLARRLAAGAAAAMQKVEGGLGWMR